MTTKVRLPETEHQAAYFTKLNNAYLSEGLCHRCSAQAAYGHQHGWTRIHLPCGACQPILKTLPRPQVNGWSSLH